MRRGPKRRRCLARVVLFFISAALITGMTGCTGDLGPPGWYELTISSTTGGTVAAPGEATFTYDAGKSVSLVASPDTGYRFDRWSGDTGTIANVNAASTTITMNGDYSITASFVAAEEYALTIASTSGGEVAEPGEGSFTYDEGTAVDLVATPDPGYRFDSWTGDTGTIAHVNSESTIITMNGNYSITANFVEIEEYTLTISSTAGGEVAEPGEGSFTYDEGTPVDLVAITAAGYVFVNWTGDTGTISNVNAASTTITMNGNYSITANFAEDTPQAECDLTISSTVGGEVTIPGEGAFTYDEGTVAGLVATPAAGYVFVNWTGDTGTIADINAASTTITMNADYSITSNFAEAEEYTLTIASTAGGEVTDPGEGAFTYDEGTVVGLVATPAAGYVFVNWTGDTGTIADVNAASTTITINGNYSITANFSETAVTQYTLTIAVSGSGSTTPAVGQHTYAAGTEVPISAAAAAGWQFVNWTGHTGTIGDVNAAATTIVVNGNYSITATFQTEPAVQYNLTVSSGTGGSVTVTVNTQQTIVGQGETKIISDITAGTTAHLAANPATGYAFSNWTGNTGTIENVNAASTTIIVNGNYSITANFGDGPGVKFPDPNLEAAIREAIGKPTGPIYESDLNDLEHLFARNKKIADLTGIEYCISLRTLDLRDNRISSIEPLAGLTSLTWLGLAHNRITGISPLAGLTNLRWLYLDGNQIADIGPLTNLTNLTLLGLWGNKIEDIKPLVDNMGLGEGDRVYLQGNPLSMQSVDEHIPALRSRGVDVYY